MKSRLILLCGLPGSGKTTLARRLAKEMPAIRFCPDEWEASLGVDYFDEAFQNRLEKRFISLTWELLALGQDVILEFGFWAESERTELRNAAKQRDHRVELYFLDTPFEELARRLEMRSIKAEHGAVPIERTQLKEYSKIFQPPTDEELALFDRPTVLPERRLNHTALLQQPKR